MRTLIACAVLGLALTIAPVPAAALPIDTLPIGQCTPPSTKPIPAESWAQRRLGADRVWPLTTGEVTVGVVDTGVSGTAPALAGAVLPGTNLAGGRGDGDCFGRGTFIASLIAARQAKDVPFAGLAPAARIFPVRVSDDPPKIQDHAALAVAIGQGIRAAVDGGAGVVAVGLVATLGVPELDAAVAYAAQRDVVVIAPVAVPKKGQLAFPARIPGVVAVAPVGREGAVSDPVYGADPLLAAPAFEVVGVAPQGAGQRVASSGELAVGYVAGAAALVRAYHPGLPAEEVVARLRDTADHPSTPLPNDIVGFGVVDPVAAVTTVPDTDQPATPTPRRVAIPVPEQVDPAPANRALWLVGGVAAVALLVAGPMAAVATRRRHPADVTHGDHTG
jgi:membrane-anchored mycosin MYCP